MQTFQGKGVSGGIAIGPIRVYRREKRAVSGRRAADAETELRRFARAREEAAGQLREIYARALREVGKTQASIFEFHQVMVRDEEFLEAVSRILRTQKVSAEEAVTEAGEQFARMLGQAEDEYLRARAADVRDVCDRLLGCLAGEGSVRAEEEAAGPPAIIAAEDLTPSETVKLDRKSVLAFVTAGGSANSHSAILARTMGIPALCGVPFSPDERLDGRMAIVDGNAGTLFVDPDGGTLLRMRERQEAEARETALLQSLKGKENVTPDGRRIQIFANVGSLAELPAAIEHDAGGIGLFRSEFLYLEKDHFPTEEEQFQVYRAAVTAMGGKPVVIRTLDIGADKQCPYFGMEKEDNPALGCRAIRICLARPEIFKTQLRALLRAAAFGNLSILYPMIASLWEVRAARALAEEAWKELKARGISCRLPRQGIMIETPAAALLSGELAKEADFFSIGTNDLTQYTLALDRQNPRLERFFDPHHPAVLALIRMTVKNARRAGIQTAVCGELGADPAMTREFLELGVDELSVSPAAILPLRKIVRETEVAGGKTI